MLPEVQQSGVRPSCALMAATAALQLLKLVMSAYPLLVHVPDEIFA